MVAVSPADTSASEILVAPTTEAMMLAMLSPVEDATAVLSASGAIEDADEGPCPLPPTLPAELCGTSEV